MNIENNIRLISKVKPCHPELHLVAKFYSDQLSQIHKRRLSIHCIYTNMQLRLSLIDSMEMSYVITYGNTLTRKRRSKRRDNNCKKSMKSKTVALAWIWTASDTRQRVSKRIAIEMMVFMFLVPSCSPDVLNSVLCPTSASLSLYKGFIPLVIPHSSQLQSCFYPKVNE